MVNKVKEIKRMSYGRCKFDLLRIKVLNQQEILGQENNIYFASNRSA